MINEKLFTVLCKKHFSYLTNKYGFSFENNVSDTWWYRLTYLNQAINLGIVIHFERRDFYIFIKLCRLINGKLVQNTGEINPKTKINCFDMDDIISLKSKNSLYPPHELNTIFNDDLFKKIVRIQANNLKTHAEEILKGDFSIFPQLEKIIKKRAKNFAFEKWGEKAHEFGW